jgi:hypothetical protein
MQKRFLQCIHCVLDGELVIFVLKTSISHGADSVIDVGLVENLPKKLNRLN